MTKKDFSTRIPVSKELRDRLKKEGTMGDTYETIIWKLLGEEKPEKKKSVWSD